MRVRVIWPLQPGICEVTPDQLFEDGFVRRFFFQPSRRELEVLRSQVKTGLHYHDQLRGWTLMAGWLQEHPFVAKLNEKLQQENVDGWIIAGGPITPTPHRHRGTAYWDTRRHNYRQIPFHTYLLAAAFSESEAPVFPLTLHIRKGDHSSQFPSQKKTLRIVKRLLQGRSGSPVLLISDCRDSGEQWVTFFNSQGIKVHHRNNYRIKSPGMDTPQSVIDFFLLARSQIILSVHWSTYAVEAALVGDIKSELIKLHRWPQRVLFKFSMSARRVKARLMMGKIPDGFL